MRATTRLRELLQRPGVRVVPGAYDCLTAKLAERAGFVALYMTGAGTSVSRLGLPDLGLVTLDEMARNAAAIAGAVSVPVIADADTGYGGDLNVRRTVREYERAGVAGLHLEDQDFPKRCGHLEGKRVVSTEKMVARLRSAVEARTDDDLLIIARTDAFALESFDEVLRRCEAYVTAGADALFVEALPTREDAERVARSFDVPCVYNVVESGRSPILSAAELGAMGFKIALFPVSALLAAMRAVDTVMRTLARSGSTVESQPQMATLGECFALVGLEAMLPEASQKG